MKKLIISFEIIFIIGFLINIVLPSGLNGNLFVPESAEILKETQQITNSGSAVQSEDEINVYDTPSEYGLYQNTPNPFNPETKISFALEHSGICRLSIYDFRGRMIKFLFNGEIQADRVYDFFWNGTDQKNNVMPSGMYFYQISSASYTVTKRMLLLK